MANQWTDDQKQAINLSSRNLLVSAAAGSGKTAVLVERIIQKITDAAHPVDIDRLLVVTFTNAAAAQMRERISEAIEKKLDEDPENIHLRRQSTLIHHAKITTIDSFCLSVVRDYFNRLDISPDFKVGDQGELKLLRADVMDKMMEEAYAKGEPDFLNLVESYAVGKADSGIRELIERLYDFSVSYPFPARQREIWSRELEITAGNPESESEKEERRGGAKEWAASVGEAERTVGGTEVVTGSRSEAAWELENASGILETTAEKADAIEENAAAGKNAELTAASLDSQLWVQQLLEEIHRLTAEMEKMCREAMEEAEEDEELRFYAPMFASDLLQIQRILQAETFAGLHEAFAGLSFVRKPVNRKFAGDPERKEYLSGLRDRLKDQLNGLKKLVLTDDEESLAQKTAANSAALKELIRLSGEFEERFLAAKRDKNMVDFGDVEHFALSILVNEDETPTDVALDYAKRFEEVMIDEYQDSNRVQELLLGSVARPDNRFMVGDVKQSIYKFRLARPELFVEKYNTYTLESSVNQKVNLSKNFRSRPEVLEQINHLFRQLMTPALGQIDYDEAAALHPGASYPDSGDDRRGELLIVDSKEEVSDEMAEDLAALHSRELEARAVAEKIRALVDPEKGMMVSDKGELRRAGYGDIVILLRTMSGWSDVFTRVLNDNGIPAIADLQSGYFDAPEVKLILDYLRIIDNPCQDIPLAAVLHSVIGGVTSEEMALMMAEYQADPERTEQPKFHKAYRYYLEKGADEALKSKLAVIEEQMEELRFYSHHLSVRDLIRRIMNMTGYDRLASAMPGGRVRRGNLEQLEQKAEDYAKTSYRGLFNFIRYIEHLQKYEVDFGEAASGENNDAVRVMSIHRSKGLEFPIVFVSGLAKPFNQQDSNARVLLHPDLGIAAGCIDLETRVRTKTLQQRVFARKMRLDSLGEELRVLYVALTRAKEKLILTACDKNPEKRWEKFAAIAAEENQALPYLWLSSAGSYLDWIMMGLTREQRLWTVENVSLTSLLTAEIETQAEQKQLRDNFIHWESGEIFQPIVREELKRRLSYVYPYESQLDMHTKLSVSELKAAARERGAESDVDYLYRLAGDRADGAEELVTGGAGRLTADGSFAEQESQSTESEDRAAELEGQFSEQGDQSAGAVDRLAKIWNRTDLIKGAKRGTILHRIMEKIDFTKAGSETEIDDQIAVLAEKGVLDKNETESVSHRPIYWFFGGNLAKRMTKAAENGKLHRESRFVMGVPAAEIGGLYQGDEMILVQGMIDAWFEEADGLVIVDYKSDRVEKETGAEVLKERYAVQLDYYRRALEQSTGKRVKECRIYSFSLGRDIVCG